MVLGVVSLQKGRQGTHIPSVIGPLIRGTHSRNKGTCGGDLVVASRPEMEIHPVAAEVIQEEVEAQMIPLGMVDSLLEELRTESSET